MNISKPSNAINIRSITGLKKILPEFDDKLKKRKEEVLSIINPFNKTQEGILRIKYSQQINPLEPPIQDWISDNFYINKLYSTYNLSLNGVISYILSIYDKVGIIDLLMLTVTNEKRQERKRYSVIDYAYEYNFNAAEKDVIELTKENELKVIVTIFDNLVTKSNVNKIIDYLKAYVNGIESFSLEFNINNNESSNEKKLLFKDVKQISLGQKVVAMLNFILGYCEYSEDYRPLIIDQPEDNLDSQYIYKNLVQQLRDVKTKNKL